MRCEAGLLHPHHKNVSSSEHGVNTSRFHASSVRKMKNIERCQLLLSPVDNTPHRQGREAINVFGEGITTKSKETNTHPPLEYR